MKAKIKKFLIKMRVIDLSSTDVDYFNGRKYSFLRCQSRIIRLDREGFEV